MTKENKKITPSESGKVALLLINTGTPAAPTEEAVSSYLTEFLSDRHIVDVPGFIWKPLLRGIIIPRRKAASAKRYAAIWTKEGSPLLSITKKTALGLQDFLGEDVAVFYAMNYGTPSIAKVLTEIKEIAPRKILLMPLYAQEARETRGASRDAFISAYKKLALTTPFEEIPAWFENPLYIRALAESIKDAKIDLNATCLIASFHGIPEETASRYKKECERTVALLERELKLEKGAIFLTYQSKFGPGRWTEPATEAVLKTEASKGTASVAVLCPGFAADCLESLEEVAMKYRDTFLSLGGKTFTYIPALNASKGALLLYKELVSEALKKEEKAQEAS